MRLPAVGQKLEFGDLLLLLYALAFFRQLTWGVPNESAAWALAIAGTLIAWSAYLYFKPARNERTPGIFWLLVAMPLLIIYASRMPLPDLSFDVLNHRLIQGERALRGPQFLPGDFFPTIFPFNPSSDMVTGVFRHLLGYRLGTIVNLLALIWTGTILERMLRSLFARAWLRCPAVLLVLFTEHAMFEISTYLVDLLALPLILEAMRLALDYDESQTRRWDLSWAALLLGGAVGLKATNVAMALPVIAIFSFRCFNARRDKSLYRQIPLSAILFALPVLPHAIYIYRETGSPFFPLYNNIFRSPLWRAMQIYDGRWGPRNWRETLLWPFVSFWIPERLSELGLYAGRLTLGFVAALVCLVLPRVTARARLVAFAALVGSLTWSVTSGYARYAIFVELLSGLLVFYLFSYFKNASSLPHRARLGLAAATVTLLILQCMLSAVYFRRTEWSRRPIALDDPQAFREESPWIVRDQDLMKFQSTENRQLFAKVDAWIVSSVKSNGVEALLRPDVPMLAVNNREYFDLPEPRRRFSQALEKLRGRRVYSLSLTDELDSSLDSLKQRNLAVGRLQNVLVPFYSNRTVLNMTLMEIVPTTKRETPRRQSSTPDPTEATAPLNDEAFRAELSVAGLPPVMSPGQTANIRVMVKNSSEFVWPSRSRQYYAFLINVADTWFQSDGTTLVNNLDGRKSLPHDLWPGEAAEVQLAIKAPPTPGNYVLEIDLVQEGVTFFRDRGSQTWHAPVKVE